VNSSLLVGGGTLDVKRFRGGLVFKAHRLCVSLNSRLESNKEEEEGTLATLYAGKRVSRSTGRHSAEM